jgi:membrane-bound lytic murein transglycosylase D
MHFSPNFPLCQRPGRVSLLVAALLGMGLSACSSVKPVRVVAAPMSAPLVQFSAPMAASSALALPDEATTILPTVEEDEVAQVDMDPVQLSPEDLAKFGDVWERMRRGFQMDTAIDNDRIAAQRNWYAQHQAYLDRMSARASRYMFHTVTEAEKRGIPTELALLPVIESGYDPFALSRAQASGMWQLIPGTAKILGVKQSWWYDGRRDVVESTRAAYDFLLSLHNKFGDWYLALAAYNCGPGAVQRAIDRNRDDGLPTDFWSLRLPAETMSYVPRLIAVAQLVAEPAKYGVTIQPIVNEPHFREVTMPAQIDLSKAAKLAGLTMDELYQLNPAFNHWATDPQGPHRLLVPSDTPDDFESQLASLPPPEQVQAVHYTVKRGDTLYSIASRYHVTPAELKRVNKLAGNRVHKGEELTIMRASSESEEFSQSQEQRLAKLEAAASAGKQGRAYKVRRGDTIFSVARRNHVNAKELARWNNISLHDHLHAGQHLTIMVASAGAGRIAIHSRGGKLSKAAQRRLAKAGKGSKASLQRISYEVRKGDTLTKIASRYRVSVSQIQSWNGRGHHIKPGQDIVLFVASNSHTGGRRGDDL